MPLESNEQILSYVPSNWVRMLLLLLLSVKGGAMADSRLVQSNSLPTVVPVTRITLSTSLSVSDSLTSLLASILLVVTIGDETTYSD